MHDNYLLPESTIEYDAVIAGFVALEQFEFVNGLKKIEYSIPWTFISIYTGWTDRTIEKIIIKFWNWQKE